MENKKLYVVMVGLPARGKSTIANRLKENLTKDSIKARIFNNGALRRRLELKNTSFAEFYDPRNTEGAALRERIALMNLERARNYLAKRGQVAILDATNVSLKRRNMTISLLKGHPLLFIECINDDPEILAASILRKIAHAEFNHFKKEAAIQNFRKRIEYYNTIYTPIKEGRNFIKLDSLNNHIMQEELVDDIPYYDRIRDFLMTDSVKKPIPDQARRDIFQPGKPNRRRLRFNRRWQGPGQGPCRVFQEQKNPGYFHQ